MNYIEILQQTNFLAAIDLKAYVFIPVLIFLSRICDVTLGTVRLIFLSRGMKILAPIVGFFEVLIWILAIGNIMQNLSNPISYIAYAGGFAMGNYVGILLVEKLSIGKVMVRILSKNDCSKLIDRLRSEGCGVTTLDGKGATGSVKIVFTVIKKKDLGWVTRLINEYNPQAFYSVSEAGNVQQGIFPSKTPSDFDLSRFPLNPFRKGK